MLVKLDGREQENSYNRDHRHVWPP